MKFRTLFPELQSKRLSLGLWNARLMLLGIMAAMFLSGLVMAPAPAAAGLAVAVTVAPPALPDYDQPPIPGPGYIWTPGYWAWDEDAGDYYWVPGAWAEAPQVGYLWTPGYWGWNDGAYLWNDGYWGPTVGFYGGICYGFGYTGVGFFGGYWSGGAFYYNRSVTNVSVNITNVYSKTVVSNKSSFSHNGPGGSQSKPTLQEKAAANQKHIAPTHEQGKHLEAARSDKGQYSKTNHGVPTVAGVSKTGQLSGNGVSSAKSAGAASGHNGTAGMAGMSGHSAAGHADGTSGHNGTGHNGTGSQGSSAHGHAGSLGGASSSYGSAKTGGSPNKAFNAHHAASRTTTGSYHPSGSMNRSSGRGAGNQAMHFPRGGPARGAARGGGSAKGNSKHR